jgi:hypothetical protein
LTSVNVGLTSVNVGLTSANFGLTSANVGRFYEGLCMFFGVFGGKMGCEWENEVFSVVAFFAWLRVKRLLRQLRRI